MYRYLIEYKHLNSIFYTYQLAYFYTKKANSTYKNRKYRYIFN